MEYRVPVFALIGLDQVVGSQPTKQSGNYDEQEITHVLGGYLLVKLNCLITEVGLECRFQGAVDLRAPLDRFRQSV